MCMLRALILSLFYDFVSILRFSDWILERFLQYCYYLFPFLLPWQLFRPLQNNHLHSKRCYFDRSIYFLNFITCLIQTKQGTSWIAGFTTTCVISVYHR